MLRLRQRFDVDRRQTLRKVSMIRTSAAKKLSMDLGMVSFATEANKNLRSVPANETASAMF